MKEERDERGPARPVWSAALILPVACCAALPLLAAGVSTGVMLLGFGIAFGAVVVGASLAGLAFALRRRRAQACRVPVQRTKEPA